MKEQKFTHLGGDLTDDGNLELKNKKRISRVADPFTPGQHFASIEEEYHFPLN